MIYSFTQKTIITLGGKFEWFNFSLNLICHSIIVKQLKDFLAQSFYNTLNHIYISKNQSTLQIAASNHINQNIYQLILQQILQLQFKIIF